MFILALTLQLAQQWAVLVCTCGPKSSPWVWVLSLTMDTDSIWQYTSIMLFRRKDCYVCMWEKTDPPPVNALILHQVWTKKMIAYQWWCLDKTSCFALRLLYLGLFLSFDFSWGDRHAHVQKHLRHCFPTFPNSSVQKFIKNTLLHITFLALLRVFFKTMTPSLLVFENCRTSSYL